MDLKRRRASRDGRPLELSPQDFTLLVLLIRAGGKVVTRKRLSHEIWQRAHDGRSNYIEVGMWRLRAKLDEPHARKLIQVVRGVGYAFAIRS